ncbi:MFS transporter [Amycolatopsis sp. FDAARGOS 1241]|uniref:MFS transporter n=1 Tax=Amycolatopsis sp. FDAARGOS 1241 TaxID=2778070 RepID=UPI00194FE75B|nr:MFS transporter [Amycolatopsis sp. FDAARGOS 1241]QRP43324.1 MFS transporter [Amycolatopsis sp. FDAARGOS 1241]
MAVLVERPRPRAVREHHLAGWFAVGAVCFGAFMGQLDASIVTLTFPALQREFGEPLAAVQWVSLAYLLTLVGTLAAVGRLADAYGRKLTYVHGFGVFTAASVACGLAPTLTWLVVFRVVQALGAAMLQANSVALVVGSVRREKMRAALGVQAAAQALGLALGPAAGGLLVDTVGWRWVFLVNAPVGLAGLIAGRYLLPRTRERTPLGRFDGAGVALLATASTAVLLAVSGLSGLRLPGWATPVLFVAGVAAAAAFVAREHRAASPILHLSVLRPPVVSLGLAGALCGYLVLFGPLALLPQVLGAHGATGAVLTCLPAGFAVAAIAADRVLPASLGSRARTGAGAILAAAGCAVLALVSGTWEVGVSLFAVGLGLGVFIPANNSAVMGAIPTRMSATGGGLVNMARGLGTALGVALVTLCLHAGGTGGRTLAIGVLAGAAVLAAGTGLASPRTPRTA